MLRISTLWSVRANIQLLQVLEEPPEFNREMFGGTVPRDA